MAEILVNRLYDEINKRDLSVLPIAELLQLLMQATTIKQYESLSCCLRAPNTGVSK